MNIFSDQANIEQAVAIMGGFAENTGLTSDQPPRRYLWTDAYAVCNFVGLSRETGDEKHLDLARMLVDQVHETLGRHRADDARSGWISGLDEEAGRNHPTRGGLRIGKRLPERGPSEPFDDRMEWDRDGQYFHYLTKWMHALDIIGRAAGEPRYALWARELAEAARKKFAYQDSTGELRMCWKMSIDLSRPLVPSMGLHDPLDGYITTLQLMASTEETNQDPTRKTKDGQPDLGDTLRTFSAMVRGRDWATADPLGLGGLLLDAARLMQLIQRGASTNTELLIDLLRAAATGLRFWVRSDTLDQSPMRRLAFRELGLAIGLKGARWMFASVESGSDVKAQLNALGEYLFFDTEIVSFWHDSQNRQNATWKAHEDINSVMLASALAPQGVLMLSSRHTSN